MEINPSSKSGSGELVVILKTVHTSLRTKKLNSSSLCQGDAIEDFIQNYFDKHYNENEHDPWNMGYQTIHQHLKEQFTVSNLVHLVQVKIEALTQGADTAEKFFQKFEILFTQAGYDRDDVYIIRLIKMNVNERIIDQIYGSLQLPVTYNQWKENMIQIDTMWKQQNNHKKTKRSTYRPFQTHVPTPPRETKESKPADQRDTTGTT